MSVRSLQPTRWLAQRLGLSVSTIERLRARGDRNLPPHVVIGPQSIRYDEAVVEAWLAARMQVPVVEVAPVPEVPASPPKATTLKKRFGKFHAAPVVPGATSAP